MRRVGDAGQLLRPAGECDGCRAGRPSANASATGSPAGHGVEMVLQPRVFDVAEAVLDPREHPEVHISLVIGIVIDPAGQNPYGEVSPAIAGGVNEKHTWSWACQTVSGPPVAGPASPMPSVSNMAPSNTGVPSSATA